MNFLELMIFLIKLIKFEYWNKNKIDINIF